MQNQLIPAIGALLILAGTAGPAQAELLVNKKTERAQHTLVLPYMAVGGAPEGWHFLTVLSLENSRRDSNSGTIEFFTGEGRPMHVQLNDSTALAARSEWRVSGKDTTLFVVSHPGGSFEDGWLRIRLTGKEPIKVIVLVQCYHGEQLFAEAGTIGDPSGSVSGPYSRISNQGRSLLNTWTGLGTIRQIALSGPLGKSADAGEINAGRPGAAKQAEPSSGCDRSQNTKVPKRYSGTIIQTGIASWIASRINRRISASGVRYNQLALTAAHRTLPFGTMVKVTNLQNGCWVKVRIADRGPYVSGRIVDLSPAAARRIGIIKDGISRVRLETIPA